MGMEQQLGYLEGGTALAQGGRFVLALLQPLARALLGVLGLCTDTGTRGEGEKEIKAIAQ